MNIVFVGVMLAGLCCLGGCAGAGGGYEETEEGRVSRVSLNGLSSSSVSGDLPAGDAVSLADVELRRRVRNPEGWSLVYCRPVRLCSGVEAYAVRFDRKGVYEDTRASDKFAKFYVLGNRRVLVADITYAE